jgi:hypothetical protein
MSARGGVLTLERRRENLYSGSTTVRVPDGESAFTEKTPRSPRIMNEGDLLGGRTPPLNSMSAEI